MKEYSIKELAELAHTTDRALRYYEECGLLSPRRNTESNYRIYTQEDVDCLQQILIYRSLDFSIAEIKRMLNDKNYDAVRALNEQKEKLMRKQKEMALLLENIEKTIEARKGGRIMEDNEKFEGIRQKVIAEQERRYGAEARVKYGEQTVDESKQRVLSMSEQQFFEVETLGNEILSLLAAAVEQGCDSSSPEAKRIVELHKRWITAFWGKENYTAKAHKGLGELYMSDERFKAYYEKASAGAAEFLRDAIVSHADSL